MREIILIIFGILIFISYFMISFSINKDKWQKGFGGLMIMTFVSAFSLFICFILIKQNDELNNKVKNKCPEYEQVKNVYKLKK